MSLMLKWYNVGTEKANLGIPRSPKDDELCSLCYCNVTFSVRNALIQSKQGKVKVWRSDMTINKFCSDYVYVYMVNISLPLNIFNLSSLHTLIYIYIYINSIYVLYANILSNHNILEETKIIFLSLWKN